MRWLHSCLIWSMTSSLGLSPESTTIIVWMKWRNVFLSTQFLCVSSCWSFRFSLDSLDGGGCRAWFNVVFGRCCNILIIARWQQCSDFFCVARFLVFCSVFPCGVTCFCCFQLGRLLPSGCLGIGDCGWCGGLDLCDLSGCFVFWAAAIRSQMLSSAQFAHLVSLRWNLPSVSLPTLSQFLALCLPAHIGHFSCWLHEMALCP